MELTGKKVLFVSPKTFGYEIEIKNKIEEFGAQVDYFDERPSNSSGVKAAIRINRNIIKRRIQRHYEKIIAANKINAYDYILFIHLETPFSDTLENLRKANPSGKYILYMWDSVFHCPNTLELVKHFDAIFTFDRFDSIKYNFHFRPLFYLNDYSKPYYADPCYDISFIGTIHSDRFRIINELEKQSYSLNFRTKWYLFIFNSLMFYRMKFSGIRNLAARKKDFSFVPLDRKNVINILQQSRVIVDIQHPDNNGLTMRTLEVLALKKKLITTNLDILNYDFYDPDNIFIVDRKKPKIEKYFFESEYKEIPQEIYVRYSIDQWLRDIFSE